MQSKYSHLLLAMRAGDVLYLTDVLDREIQSVVYKRRGRVATANFVAVAGDPATAHRVVRITMLHPLDPGPIRPQPSMRPKGRPRAKG